MPSFPCGTNFVPLAGKNRKCSLLACAANTGLRIRDEKKVFYMEFRLESDFAEAYECAASLNAYARRTQYKMLEAGTAWVKETAAMLSPSLQKTLQKLGDPERFDTPLYIWSCPGERTAQGFGNWLSGLSKGELYDLASSTGESVPSGLPEIKDRIAEALQMWNEQYFSRIDPEILNGLKQAEQQLKKEIASRTPEEVFESATCGMRLSPGMPPPERVVLVPQYHQRPFNLSSFYPKLAITLRLFFCRKIVKNPSTILLLVTLTRFIMETSITEGGGDNDGS